MAAVDDWQANHIRADRIGHRNRVRRIDDLGRVVIPKEIRRTMRIREGEPSYTTLALFDRFCLAIHSMVKRAKAR